MKIIPTLFVIFLLNLSSINASISHNFSSKVKIWHHHIKIYKCPIDGSEINEIKNDIDPSILIFKSRHFTNETLEKTPVIVANQTNYLAHHVKGLISFNEFSFAYASMASLHHLFDVVHIVKQPGYFQNKNNPNREYVPDDEIMVKLNAKFTSRIQTNVFQIDNKTPVYKCKGINGSMYLLVKSSNITMNLKVNDVIFSEKSDGFLETIRAINRVDVTSNDHRLIIETKLTDCTFEQNMLESSLKYLRLISLERNDLNCQGGYNSNLSLYLTKNTTYISRLIEQNLLLKSVIVGRKSNKFAYRIVSIKKMGSTHFLFETSKSLFPMNKIRNKRCAWYDVGCWAQKAWRAAVRLAEEIARRAAEIVQKAIDAVSSTMLDWNYTMQLFTYTEIKSVSLQPIGSTSISFSFSPSVTVTASLRAGLFGVNVYKAGIIINLNTNLNAKLNFNLKTIDYDWPEQDIIPMKHITSFAVPLGPIAIPGTINAGLSTIVRNILLC
jgi:hypothetical protein